MKPTNDLVFDNSGRNLITLEEKMNKSSLKENGMAITEKVTPEVITIAGHDGEELTPAEVTKIRDIATKFGGQPAGENGGFAFDNPESVRDFFSAVGKAGYSFEAVTTHRLKAAVVERFQNGSGRFDEQV